MADVRPAFYWPRVVPLFLGILLILLSAFGISLGPADLFKVGVAVCFFAFVF
jgi:hypothetical protein